jgi:hypothetical protein
VGIVINLKISLNLLEVSGLGYHYFTGWGYLQPIVNSEEAAEF